MESNLSGFSGPVANSPATARLSCKEEEWAGPHRGKWVRLALCFQLVTEAWLLLCPMFPWLLGAETTSIWPQQGLLGFLPLERCKAKIPCVELHALSPPCGGLRHCRLRDTGRLFLHPLQLSEAIRSCSCTTTGLDKACAQTCTLSWDTLALGGANQRAVQN